MKRLYFENQDAEFCHDEQYFRGLMKERGLAQIDVLAAIPLTGYPKWCSRHACSIEQGDCGRKACGDYRPVNKVSGRCTDLSRAYTYGERVTFKDYEH